ncbi:MAG: DUF2127 domain-containing protein [Myxococcales bacterium]|nr:DUF2127 domain-containing protein [Myxococcales bacterium]
MTRRPVGLEAIILYKLIKAVLEALLGMVAVFLLARGAEAGAATLAEILLEHFTGGWALQAATLIVRVGTSGHVKFIAAAAFGDAVLSAVEGLALQAGRWWAPWLVVIATGALLPLELWELARHPHWGRFVILAINVAVVAYLLRGVVREHRNVRVLTRPVDRQVDGP